MMAVLMDMKFCLLLFSYGLYKTIESACHYKALSPKFTHTEWLDDWRRRREAP